MTLRDSIERYIAWRRAHGAKFVTSAGLLHCFCKHVGGNLDCDAVGEAEVLSFLAGNGPLTRSRANKYGALAGFWRYAISRGDATRSPLPALDDEPRKPRSALPYVYSHDELRRLFRVIDVRWQRPVQLDRDTLRALLLVLYGAGLRFGEAQRLTLSDVNLSDAILTVRDTKVLQKPSCSRRSAAHRGFTSLCRQAGRKTLAAGYGLSLPGKPRWHVFGKTHRSNRVRQAAPGGWD